MNSKIVATRDIQGFKTLSVSTVKVPLNQYARTKFPQLALKPRFSNRDFATPQMPIIKKKAVADVPKETHAKTSKTLSLRTLRTYMVGTAATMVKNVSTIAGQRVPANSRYYRIEEQQNRAKIMVSIDGQDYPRRQARRTYGIEDEGLRDRGRYFRRPCIAKPMNGTSWASPSGLTLKSLREWRGQNVLYG